VRLLLQLVGRWLLRPVLWVLRLGISKKRLLRRSRNNIKVTAWYGADFLSFLVFLVGACTLLCRQFGSNASVDDLLESVKECHSPRSSILNNITMDFVESVYSCFAPSNVNHLSTVTFSWWEDVYIVAGSACVNGKTLWQRRRLDSDVITLISFIGNVPLILHWIRPRAA